MQPNHKIRWGIIGAGHIARSFASDVNSMPDAEVLAVGSRSAAKAENFCKELNIQKAYGSYTDLVEDPDIDVVYIATPHVFHKAHSLLCLKNNKAVLVEKPFATTAADAKEVISTAQNKNLFCMEAMWMRFIPAMRKAIALIGEGEIGELLMITASLGFYNEMDPESRLFDPKLGGGALLDLGVYPLSLVVQLLGQPVSISSRAKIGKTGVDEHFAAMLGFSDGRSALISANINAHNQNDAFILGSNAAIHIETPLYRPTTIRLHRYHTSNSKRTHQNSMMKSLYSSQMVRSAYQVYKKMIGRSKGELTYKVPCKGNGYAYEAAEVGRCLRDGAIESSIMPLAETIDVLEIVDAIRENWLIQA